MKEDDELDKGCYPNSLEIYIRQQYSKERDSNRE